jgi:hypothetical protein
VIVEWIAHTSTFAAMAKSSSLARIVNCEPKAALEFLLATK